MKTQKLFSTLLNSDVDLSTLRQVAKAMGVTPTTHTTKPSKWDYAQAIMQARPKSRHGKLVPVAFLSEGDLFTTASGKTFQVVREELRAHGEMEIWNMQTGGTFTLSEVGGSFKSNLFSMVTCL
jgi:hypothetical protein